MKTVLLIFLGLLILQSKLLAYHGLIMLGCCWGAEPVPLLIKVMPFIKSVILALILEALFTGILIGFSLKVLATMCLIEIAADIFFAIAFGIACLYYRLWDSFRSLE